METRERFRDVACRRFFDLCHLHNIQFAPSAENGLALVFFAGKHGTLRVREQTRMLVFSPVILVPIAGPK